MNTNVSQNNQFGTGLSTAHPNLTTIQKGNATKIILKLSLIIFLTACDNQSKEQPPPDNTQNLTSINLTGSWRHTVVDKYYENGTDTYVGSVSVDSGLIVNDTEMGVEYSECQAFGTLSRTATKTKSSLELDGYSVGFTMLSTNVLETAEFEPPTDSSVPADQYRLRHYRLVKVSDSLNIDKGMLTLSGPVSIMESNQVCLWKVYSDPDLRKSYELIVPYDDGFLSLYISYIDRPDVGDINYDLSDPSPLIIGFDVMSNATKFWNVVGSNSLGPTTATINISKSSVNRIAGTFSFIGQDMGDYSGEFIMQTNY